MGERKTPIAKQGRGCFFAIGKKQWSKVCGIGLNPAVAMIVMACGTGRDNKTTAWSANAVEKYGGIGWRRSKEAIEVLCKEGLVNQIKQGERPRYQVLRPEDDELIWLPNEIVTGAADEVPPVMRLRQTREVELLQLLVSLYGEHDLADDGGLPRKLLCQHFHRERIMDRAQFTIYGFDRDREKHCDTTGPLALFAGRKEGKGTARERIEILEQLGLIEWIDYLAESAEQDAELLHPVSGDDQASAVAASAFDMASELPGGFKFEAGQFDYVLPVLAHMKNAAVVSVARLRYRPRTSRTAAWYARHVESCRAAIEMNRGVLAKVSPTDPFRP